MKKELSILQHGLDWYGQDVYGYYGSEKLNGCRAYWTGYELLSRSGRRIQAPERITRPLPVGVPIDGELYAGVNGFQLTSIAARYHRFDCIENHKKCSETNYILHSRRTRGNFREEGPKHYLRAPSMAAMITMRDLAFF